MRVGLFTDTYKPATNGIVSVVDSLERELRSLGHEVHVVCPAWSGRYLDQVKAFRDSGEGGVVGLPSVRGWMFYESRLVVCAESAVRRRVDELRLDVVHILTPSLIGCAGVSCALRNGLPLVVQHCTDNYEFVEHYPSTLPALLFLTGVQVPSSLGLGRRDVLDVAEYCRPHLSVTKWNKEMVRKATTLLYSRADAVVALSRKSRLQLESWQSEKYSYPVTIMPNGVDALAEPSPEKVSAFRKMWGLGPEDEVVGFVGRLAEEKNLPVLIRAFARYVADSRPKAKLVFVGDFTYRSALEAMAEETHCADRIVFTGAIPRDELGVAYAVLDVFVFPSVKDTQGWVLHEAAHAGVPLVVVDPLVSEVVRDGVNAYLADNSPESIAEKIVELLGDPARRAEFGRNGRRLAACFTERGQVLKLERLYRELLDVRHPR